MPGICYCVLGWFSECENSDDPYHQNPKLGIVPERIGPVKEDEAVTDPKSTGRKRAVQVKPIIEGMTCEWANLKVAGGGVFPIVGCPGNKATNVHHGPDKNTLNNTETNLHRICSNCHNRWHTRNDPTYDEDRPGNTWLPKKDWVVHDPDTKATVEEVLKHEIYWNMPAKQRELVDAGRD